MLSILSDYSGIVNIVSKTNSDPLELDVVNGAITVSMAPKEVKEELARIAAVTHDTTLEALYSVAKTLDATHPNYADQIRSSLIL